MSRLVIVLPCEPLTAGQSFAVHEWPLHVTVLAPFLTRAEPAVIADAVAAASAHLTAITATAGPDALFGRRENVLVTLLHDNPQLTSLHRQLIVAVRPMGSKPSEPAFAPSGFRPHVTVKGQARLHEGERVTLEQIAIVDMAPRAHAAGRTVLATIPLARLK